MPGNPSPPPDYHALNSNPQDNALNKITLKCTFVDVDNIGGYSWQFVLPLNSCTTWRALCDKLSTCLSLIRDLEGVPYPGETTFWARDVTADGFICKEDWEQLVYGGGKYELIFRSNARIKPNLAAPRDHLVAGVGAPVGRAIQATSTGAATYSAQPPRFAGGRRSTFPE